MLFVAVLVSFSSVSTFAQTSKQSIHFAQGTDQKTQTGQFKGYDDVQYQVYAKQGQRLKFEISSHQHLASINIFAPGKKPGQDDAILLGASQGQTGDIILPADGEYTLQVYQMRNSARKNKTVNFKLDLQILNEAQPKVKNFDAVGELPCSLALGQPTRQCQFGVVRQGHGTAKVTVFSLENKAYLLNFEHGKLISPQGHTEKRADLSLIELKTNERFEVPDAIIYGG